MFQKYEEYNRPYIIDDFDIHANIVLKKEDILPFISFIKDIFKKMTRRALKTIKYFGTINEMLYTSLDYSEAKTVTGLIMVICFITIITFHLFCSLIKKNKKIKMLEQELRILQNK